MEPVLYPWLVESVIIVYRTVQGKSQVSPGQRRIPLPSEFAATFVVFGGVALFARRYKDFALIFGWGVVLATWLNLFDPTNPFAVIPSQSSPGVAPGAAPGSAPGGNIQNPQLPFGLVPPGSLIGNQPIQG